jgi:hypothetical protein
MLDLKKGGFSRENFRRLVVEIKLVLIIRQ